MHEIADLFGRAYQFTGYALDMSYTPFWNAIKSFACAWIAIGIMSYTPDEDTQFKPRISLAATVLFMLCIMELARVMTGIAAGVSPFVSLILLMLAWRLHVAKGNVANIRAA